MTRYSPATWLTVPAHFGRRPDVQTREAGTITEVALADAALDQHHAALQVNDELTRRGIPVSVLATALGENAEHLRRKLTGKATASLRDIAAWRQAPHLDLESLQATAPAVTLTRAGTPYSRSPQPATGWPTKRRRTHTHA